MSDSQNKDEQKTSDIVGTNSEYKRVEKTLPEEHQHKTQQGIDNPNSRTHKNLRSIGSFNKRENKDIVDILQPQIREYKEQQDIVAQSNEKKQDVEIEDNITRDTKDLLDIDANRDNRPTKESILQEELLSSMRKKDVNAFNENRKKPNKKEQEYQDKAVEFKKVNQFIEERRNRRLKKEETVSTLFDRKEKSESQVRDNNRTSEKSELESQINELHPSKLEDEIDQPGYVYKDEYNIDQVEIETNKIEISRGYDEIQISTNKTEVPSDYEVASLSPKNDSEKEVNTPEEQFRTQKSEIELSDHSQDIDDNIKSFNEKEIPDSSHIIPDTSKNENEIEIPELSEKISDTIKLQNQIEISDRNSTIPDTIKNQNEVEIVDSSQVISDRIKDQNEKIITTPNTFNEKQSNEYTTGAFDDRPAGFNLSEEEKENSPLDSGTIERTERFYKKTIYGNDSSINASTMGQNEWIESEFRETGYYNDHSEIQSHGKLPSSKTSQAYSNLSYDEIFQTFSSAGTFSVKQGDSEEVDIINDAGTVIGTELQSAQMISGAEPTNHIVRPNIQDRIINKQITDNTLTIIPNSTEKDNGREYAQVESYPRWSESTMGPSIGNMTQGLGLGSVFRPWFNHEVGDTAAVAYNYSLPLVNDSVSGPFSDIWSFIKGSNAFPLVGHNNAGKTFDGSSPDENTLDSLRNTSRHAAFMGMKMLFTNVTSNARIEGTFDSESTLNFIQSNTQGGLKQALEKAVSEEEEKIASSRLNKYNMLTTPLIEDSMVGRITADTRSQLKTNLGVDTYSGTAISRTPAQMYNSFSDYLKALKKQITGDYRFTPEMKVSDEELTEKMIREYNKIEWSDDEKQNRYKQMLAQLRSISNVRFTEKSGNIIKPQGVDGFISMDDTRSRTERRRSKIGNERLRENISLGNNSNRFYIRSPETTWDGESSPRVSIFGIQPSGEYEGRYQGTELSANYLLSPTYNSSTPGISVEYKNNFYAAIDNDDGEYTWLRTKLPDDFSSSIFNHSVDNINEQENITNPYTKFITKDDIYTQRNIKKDFYDSLKESQEYGESTIGVFIEALADDVTLLRNKIIIGDNEFVTIVHPNYYVLNSDSMYNDLYSQSAVYPGDPQSYLRHISFEAKMPLNLFTGEVEEQRQRAGKSGYIDYLIKKDERVIVADIIDEDANVSSLLKFLKNDINIHSAISIPDVLRTSKTANLFDSYQYSYNKSSVEYTARFDPYGWGATNVQRYGKDDYISLLNDKGESVYYYSSSDIKSDAVVSDDNLFNNLTISHQETKNIGDANNSGSGVKTTLFYKKSSSILKDLYDSYGMNVVKSIYEENKIQRPESNKIGIEIGTYPVGDLSSIRRNLGNVDFLETETDPLTNEEINYINVLVPRSGKEYENLSDAQIFWREQIANKLYNRKIGNIYVAPRPDVTYTKELWERGSGNKSINNGIYIIPFQFSAEITGESRQSNWNSHNAYGRSNEFFIWNNTSSRQVSLKTTYVVTDAEPTQKTAEGYSKFPLSAYHYNNLKDSEAVLNSERSGYPFGGRDVDVNGDGQLVKNPIYSSTPGGEAAAQEDEGETGLRGWTAPVLHLVMEKYRSLVLPISLSDPAYSTPPVIMVNVNGMFKRKTKHSKVFMIRWIVEDVNIESRAEDFGYDMNNFPMGYDVNLTLKEVFSDWGDYADIETSLLNAEDNVSGNFNNVPVFFNAKNERND